MSTKKPMKKSKTIDAKVEHILFSPLHSAVRNAGILVSKDGVNTKEYRVLMGLKKVPADRRESRLSPHRTVSLQPYIKTLEDDLHHPLGPKLKQLWDRVAHFDYKDAKDGAESPAHLRTGRRDDTEIVQRYLAHIEQRLDLVRSDPILHRQALAARARCLEFECDWDALVTELLEIVRIEEDLLKDPVEAARTRARMAEALIEQGGDEALAQAKANLVKGLRAIEGNDKIWRTRLELLLALAHVHLQLGEYKEGHDVLANQCREFLRQLRAGKNAGCFLELAASYDVRMGVVLKGQCREFGKDGRITEAMSTEYSNDMREARARLVAGALIRAKLRHLTGTARAIRHLGGIYALPDWGLEPAEGLPRALWYYRAAMAVFRKQGDEGNETRTHFNCGKVSWLMWKAIADLTDQQQTSMLKAFGQNLGQQFEGDEAELVSHIQSMCAPHTAGGDFPFAQPFRAAAIAHYEAYLEARKGEPATSYVREATLHLAELNEVRRNVPAGEER